MKKNFSKKSLEAYFLLQLVQNHLESLVYKAYSCSNFQNKNYYTSYNRWYKPFFFTTIFLKITTISLVVQILAKSYHEMVCCLKKYAIRQYA